MKLTILETERLIEKYIPKVTDATRQKLRHVLRKNLPLRRTLALRRLVKD